MEKIRKNLIFLILFIVIIVTITISIGLCNKDYINFCNGFLGNLFSDILVALILGTFLVKYLESQNHPYPTFSIGGETSIKISKNSAKTDGFVLSFDVLNKNKIALKQGDGFYHIYISNKLSPEIRRGTTGHERKDKIDNLKDFTDFHDSNPGPCLYDSYLFTLEIACKLHQPLNATTIYYYFNTETGIYPKSCRFNKSAIENVKTWGKINITFV